MSPPRNLGRPATPSATYTSAADQYKEIQECVSDSIVDVCGATEFQTKLAKSLGVGVTRAQATKAIAAAMAENSTEFIETAKAAGMLAVTEHLGKPLKVKNVCALSREWCIGCRCNVNSPVDSGRKMHANVSWRRLVGIHNFIISLEIHPVPAVAKSKRRWERLGVRSFFFHSGLRLGALK